jgi:hypothetical protein
MHIRTHAHSEARHFFRQAGRKALALFLLGISAVSAASAQKGKPNSRNGDAVLHIRVHVVPVVITPRAVQKNVSSGVVIYNITTSQPSVETTETTTLLPGALVGSSGSSGAGSGIVVLKTLTIVAK